MKKILFLLTIGLALLQTNCNSKYKTVDINDCDTIGNYYENGEHFIRRDLFNDDGVIDYNKMLKSYKGRDTECNPLNQQFNTEK
ncbi:MAG TPA: hypothetical protein PK079_11700 [Leptospiraceae bacterium]|nr:hypothetical protein [Leptospiraceae bacterium]HMW07591.1 hypothetical protein [Leptospiraceae bacterium]HMX33031.1 hypothetical protein [Leptospiraceae bacterium]HMY33194.1 hypothetical protein [Leptospiraceae bacterium]HMZ66349.1 hypothetical protein [Leptospiraceae bacterium]